MTVNSRFLNVSYITVLKAQVRGQIAAFTLANIFCWGVPPAPAHNSTRGGVRSGLDPNPMAKS